MYTGSLSHIIMKIFMDPLIHNRLIDLCIIIIFKLFTRSTNQIYTLSKVNNLNVRKLQKDFSYQNDCIINKLKYQRFNKKPVIC